MTNTWMNNDGLYIKYSTAAATPNIAGEYHNDGPVHITSLKIDLTKLTETETIQSDVTVLPKGAIIQEIEVLTETAAATGTAIDLGLVKTDRTTEIDYNGILAAYPTASMDTGDFNRLSEGVGTYNGALLGVPLTYTGHITCSRTDSTAFTAGLIFVNIRYFVPV